MFSLKAFNQNCLYIQTCAELYFDTLLHSRHIRLKRLRDLIKTDSDFIGQPYVSQNISVRSVFFLRYKGHQSEYLDEPVASMNDSSSFKASCCSFCNLLSCSSNWAGNHTSDIITGEKYIFQNIFVR